MSSIAQTLIIALNRDATREVQLTLAPHTKDSVATEWLLVHALPVTASLSGSLARMLNLSGPSDVEFVRVAYVVSEVHAYCLLCKCASTEAARRLKEAAEASNSAPGTAMAVEYAQPTAAVIMGEAPQEEAAVLPLQDILFYRIPDDALPSACAGPSKAASPTAVLPTLETLLPGSVPLVRRDDPCPICQVEALSAAACVVTLCQHTFHLQCYSQLPSDSSDCPLCRFSVYDLLNDARCEGCGTYEDLWVCLLCGYVGCGRGRRNHQQEHYRATSHPAFFQTSTSRIWNYSSHMFLHQEVSILLGEFDDRHSAEKPFPHGDSSASLDSKSWAHYAVDTAHDAALQAALDESRDEAVRQYYSDTLDALMAKQREFYEQQHRSLQAGQSSSVVAIVAEEQRARLHVVNDYIEGLRQAVSKQRMAWRSMNSALRKRRIEMEEEMEMQSSMYSNAKVSITRLRERAKEMESKGRANIEAKKQTIEQLEQQVQEAMEEISSS